MYFSGLLNVVKYNDFPFISESVKYNLLRQQIRIVCTSSTAHHSDEEPKHIDYTAIVGKADRKFCQ